MQVQPTCSNDTRFSGEIPRDRHELLVLRREDRRRGAVRGMTWSAHKVGSACALAAYIVDQASKGEAISEGRRRPCIRHGDDRASNILGIPVGAHPYDHSILMVVESFYSVQERLARDALITPDANNLSDSSSN